MNYKKICTGCKKVLHSSKFNKNSYKKDLLTDKCKICINEQRRSKYDPEKAKNHRQLDKIKYKDRNKHLLDTYGITQVKYDEILMSQGNVCKICKQYRLVSTKNFMPVDHCHKTGKVRGILCNWCNRAIGFFNDNLDLLEKAMCYLKEIDNEN